MDEKDRQSAFMSALTTEHFVLQTTASATVTEAAGRASIYMLALSSTLVAMGFASQSSEGFGPFTATVLPAVFLLGLFTIIRLVDIGDEYRQCLSGIARIRGYYRSLTPEAAEYFAAAHGRWPEAPSPPTLQLGARIAFLTTTSTMIGFVNSIVAGAGVALLARWLLGPQRTPASVLIGVTAAGILFAVFLRYQKWRFDMLDASAPRAKDEDAAARMRR